ncbi:MAG: HAD family hydrolase [Myxococcaceae bacterium]
MQPTVLLFDIDGTLVTTGGAGRRALERAFEARWGRADALGDLRLDGMTDIAIVRHGLKALGRNGTTQDIHETLAAYVSCLGEEVANADAAHYRVHPGMREALSAAIAQEIVAVGLGTGNIQDGARVKLSRVGLYEHFSFGGFGDDHEQREQLIAKGAERGANQLGHAVTDCRIVVIGDTPKDVAAALHIGATCIGVGTGSFSAAQLRAAGAKHAFDTLAAPGAIQALLDG